MTDSFIIETDRLTRDFKSVCAVDGLDLSIEGSELFGLAGPDGAGKTTTCDFLQDCSISAMEIPLCLALT